MPNRLFIPANRKLKSKNTYINVKPNIKSYSVIIPGESINLSIPYNLTYLIMVYFENLLLESDDYIYKDINLNFVTLFLNFQDYKLEFSLKTSSGYMELGKEENVIINLNMALIVNDKTT